MIDGRPVSWFSAPTAATSTAESLLACAALTLMSPAYAATKRRAPNYSNCWIGAVSDRRAPDVLVERQAGHGKPRAPISWQPAPASWSLHSSSNRTRQQGWRPSVPGRFPSPQRRGCCPSAPHQSNAAARWSGQVAALTTLRPQGPAAVSRRIAEPLRLRPSAPPPSRYRKH